MKITYTFAVRENHCWHFGVFTTSLFALHIFCIEIFIFSVVYICEHSFRS